MLVKIPQKKNERNEKKKQKACALGLEPSMSGGGKKKRGSKRGRARRGEAFDTGGRIVKTISTDTLENKELPLKPSGCPGGWKITFSGFRRGGKHNLEKRR